jgi:hypothetical protein
MVKQLLDNAQKNVMKTMIYVLKQKKGGTLTTTREKKRNENSGLSQNGQKRGYPYYYIEQNQATLTTTREFLGYRHYYTQEN